MDSTLYPYFKIHKNIESDSFVEYNNEGSVCDKETNQNHLQNEVLCSVEQKLVLAKYCQTHQFRLSESPSIHH